MSIEKIRNIGLDKIVTQVYDFDSLTTDELICKIVQKINLIIEHYNFLDKKLDNKNEILAKKIQYILDEGIEKKIYELIEKGVLLGMTINDIYKIIDDKLNEALGKFDTKYVGVTLNDYEGNTLNDKMCALFNDINANHKNDPMCITLPTGVVEINTDLVANGWTNKVFKGNCILYCNNCNAPEFKQCQHNDIYIHRVSSTKPGDSDNPQGFIAPTLVSGLSKRGIKITDCSYNKFEFNSILGFTNGIEVYSEYGALGSFYNNIYFEAIWRCKRPMTFKVGKAIDDTSSQSGWITEIYTHGGMFDCSDGILIGQEPSDRPANEPHDNYQGLKFYNIGVEHVRNGESACGFYFAQGHNNAILYPRFEGSLQNGGAISGKYTLVKESGYAYANRVITSNYPMNVDRISFNIAEKQIANPSYDNQAGSIVEGDLYDTTGFRCGSKAISTPGKMVYEGYNMSNYYLNNAKNNTINYTWGTTEVMKVKTSDGTVKTVGYTS